MVIKIVATIVAMLCIVIFGCFLICDKDGYFDAKKIIVNYSNIFSKSKLKVRMIYAVLLILSVSIGIVETINSDLIESVTLIVSVLSGVFLAFLPVVMDLKNKDIKSIKEDVYKNTCKEMICTPKVRHFWRCIFLWQRKGKNIENTRQNSNYLL